MRAAVALHCPAHLACMLGAAPAITHAELCCWCPQLLALRTRWEGTTSQQLTSTGHGVAALVVALPLLLLTCYEAPRTIRGLVASLKSQARAAAEVKASPRKSTLKTLRKVSGHLLSTMGGQGPQQEADQAGDQEDRLVLFGACCQVQALQRCSRCSWPCSALAVLYLRPPDFTWLRSTAPGCAACVAACRSTTCTRGRTWSWPPTC